MLHWLLALRDRTGSGRTDTVETIDAERVSYGRACDLLPARALARPQAGLRGGKIVDYIFIVHSCGSSPRSFATTFHD